MSAPLRRQAALLTMANAVTRGLGFLLRLVFARLMGAEALGVLELANSAGMLFVTPVVAGVPSAISRMAARARPEDRPQVLRCGLRYVLRASLVLSPALLVLSPFLCWLLGESAALPALLTYAPVLALMGLCAVYSGYAVGVERPGVPALNECIEQTVRFLLCLLLLWLPIQRGKAITAAIPGMAQIAAGLTVAALFRHAFPLRGRPLGRSAALNRELLHLAAPMMLSRLCATGLRSLNAVLLPACLVRSGLTQAAATAQFGLLNGMAMPLIMIPGVVTGALCTVATPVVSRTEGDLPALKRLIRRLLLAAGGIGAAAMAGLSCTADLFAGPFFHTQALAPLVRVLCPLSLLMSLRQVQMGVIAGLGLQQRSLPGTLLGSAVSLLVTAWLAPMPEVRIFGAAVGCMAGQALELVWSAAVLGRRLRTLRRMSRSSL